jgi:hypothetical protein
MQGYWVFERGRVAVQTNPFFGDTTDGQRSIPTNQFALLGPVTDGQVPTEITAPIWYWNGSRFVRVIASDKLRRGVGYWFFSESGATIDLNSPEP